MLVGPEMDIFVVPTATTTASPIVVLIATTVAVTLTIVRRYRTVARRMPTVMVSVTLATMTLTMMAY